MFELEVRHFLTGSPTHCPALHISDLRAPQLCEPVPYSKSALAAVAQWIECRPTNQRVTSLIPTQGTCLGCGPGPQWGA